MALFLSRRVTLFFWIFISITHVLDAQSDQILWDAEWSADGKYIAITSADHHILLFSGNDFKFIDSIDIKFRGLRLSWHPNDPILAIARTEGFPMLIDFETDQHSFIEGSIQGTRGIDWNSDGTQIAVVNYDESITLWNNEDFKVRHQKSLSSKSFLGVDWHPHKNEFVALSDSIRIFSEELNVVSSFKHRNENVIPLSVEWHPVGEFYALGDYGYENIKTFLLFVDVSGEVVFRSEISEAEIRNLSWSKDGKYLATASDALRIWTKDGELISESKTEDLLWGVDWSPQGKFIMSSSANGKIVLWSSRGKMIRELKY